MQETESFVEIWSAAASAEQPSELERCCEAWLTTEERQRAARFRKDTSRNQHIVGRGMTRKLLSIGPLNDQPTAPGNTADPVPPSQIVLGFTPHGKPFVVAPQELVRPFNVAHTDGMVLFASRQQDHRPVDPALSTAGLTSRDRQAKTSGAAAGPHGPNEGTTIGIDVERISRRTDVALAERYFAPPEVEYVFDHGDAERRLAAFLRVWTLKEAFIKAIGTGLTMPLGDFAFEQIDDERPRVRMLNPALGNGENWHFIAFSPAAGYMGALAISDWPTDRVAQYRLRPFESLLRPSPGITTGVRSATHTPTAS